MAGKVGISYLRAEIATKFSQKWLFGVDRIMVLYDTGIAAYTLGVRLAAVAGNDKARRWLRGRSEPLPQTVQGQKTVWFHVASLGEFEIGRPVIEAFRKERPDWRIVLTFFSPSGYEVRKDWPVADAVCYLPADTRANAVKFLDAVKPDLAVFVKDEFWLNHLSELNRRQIPAYLVSAIMRPKDVFFKPWGGIFRDALRNFKGIFVLDEQSRSLLEGIGCKAVEVTGDTRNDRMVQLAAEPLQEPVIENFARNCNIFVAGSPHKEDERIVIPFVNAHPELKFIITPHEINESHIQSLQRSLSRPSVRLTECRAAASKTGSATILINDTVGILGKIYRHCRWAYIGGAFGHLMHSVQEPAVYGVPCVFGPRYDKFKEASDLIALGAASSVHTTAEIEDWFAHLNPDSETYASASKAARSYISDNCGATARILDNLCRELEAKTAEGKV